MTRSVVWRCTWQIGSWAEAGPGAVLVSTTVKDLVLGSGIVFADQGPQLRGAPVTWNLFQVTSVP